MTVWKRCFLTIFLFAIPGFASDQSNLYLKAGVHAGSPRGIGINSRLVVGFYNLETSLNYGYFINSFQIGGGLRFPIGEINELFLNLGYDGLYSENVDLNISHAWSLEAQHERKIGRTSFSTFAALGISLFPEDNEVSAIYPWPVARIGITKIFDRL
jgi:hypothetical protein